MMRVLIVTLFLLILGCDDPGDPVATLDCPVWSTCEGALSIRSEVVQGAFKQSRPGRFLPGDTMLLKWTFSNHAKTRGDSVHMQYWAPGAVDCCAGRTFRLEAGEVRQVVDTIIIGFTHGAASILNVSAYSIDASQSVQPVLLGVRTLPLEPSGFSIDWISMPPPVTFVHGDHTHYGPRVWHKQTFTFLARVTNTYAVPTMPFKIGACVWDYDHCFQVFTSADSIPRLNPGESADMDFDMTFDPGNFYEWWGEQPYTISLCAHHGYLGGPCRSDLGLLVTANFEAACTTVETAIVGVVVQDAQPECGRDREVGSAYRLPVRAGERYRLIHNHDTRNVFFSPPNGVYYGLPGTQDITVVKDGYYYVVLRHSGPVTFKIEKI